MECLTFAIVDLALADLLEAMTRFAADGNWRAVEDYVSSVDWSNAGDADPAVRDLLGEIELLAHEASEDPAGAAAAFSAIRSRLMAAA